MTPRRVLGLPVALWWREVLKTPHLGSLVSKPVAPRVTDFLSLTFHCKMGKSRQPFGSGRDDEVRWELLQAAFRAGAVPLTGPLPWGSRSAPGLTRRHGARLPPSGHPAQKRMH